MTDIAAIAKGLTKAGRRAVLALDAVRFTPWDKVWRQRRQRIKAHAMGLTEPERLHGGVITMWCNIRLTPLGLAVRQHLQENER